VHSLTLINKHDHLSYDTRLLPHHSRPSRHTDNLIRPFVVLLNEIPSDAQAHIVTLTLRHTCRQTRTITIDLENIRRCILIDVAITVVNLGLHNRRGSRGHDNLNDYACGEKRGGLDVFGCDLQRLSDGGSDSGLDAWHGGCLGCEDGVSRGRGDAAAGAGDLGGCELR
jgi:hypothetical protein